MSTKKEDVDTSAATIKQTLLIPIDVIMWFSNLKIDIDKKAIEFITIEKIACLKKPLRISCFDFSKTTEPISPITPNINHHAIIFSCFLVHFLPMK